jgi:hypothetical protein
MTHFVSLTCQGETCHFADAVGIRCGQPATHKVGEEVGSDAPPLLRKQHNLTAYLCCDHFRLIMGAAVSCPVVEEVQPGDPPVPPAICLDCGLDYADFPMDLLLPRWQWLLIHPADSGLLCAQCITKRAAKVPGAVALHAVIGIVPPDKAPLIDVIKAAT